MLFHGWGHRTVTALRILRAGRFRTIRATIERSLFPAGLFRRNCLIIASLDQPLPPVRFSKGFKLRWASRRDLAALTLVRDRPAEFGDFFSRGYLCLIGEVDGNPVSFSWLELETDHVSRPNAYQFDLGSGAAWAFGCELRRGTEFQGLFHLHWYRKMELLERGGVDRVFTAIQDDCELSRLAYSRVGFSPEYRVGVLRVLGATLHRAVPVRQPEAASQLGFGRWHGRSQGFATS